MERLIFLTDYKKRFGSKHFDNPYRSGFDKAVLKDLFKEKAYEIEFYEFAETHRLKDYSIPVLYTSSEDYGNFYKSFIEDTVHYLMQLGYNVIPKYKYLRAHNNKVFMEYLRKSELHELGIGIKSSCFGTFEELVSSNLYRSIKYPVVLKTSDGANATGVFLAQNTKALQALVRKSSRCRNLKFELRDILRSYRHKGYIRDSKYRRKFILQEYIPNLINDWKIYVFGSKYYIFYRPILKHRGFRASGGGYNNYKYGQDANPPEGIFDFAKEVFEQLNTPHVSIDIAWDGQQFYLIEFQCMYFGTAGIPYSKGYFTKEQDNWKFISAKHSIEEVYVDSIVEYLKPIN